MNVLDIEVVFSELPKDRENVIDPGVNYCPNCGQAELNPHHVVVVEYELDGNSIKKMDKSVSKYPGKRETNMDGMKKWIASLMCTNSECDAWGTAFYDENPMKSRIQPKKYAESIRDGDLSHWRAIFQEPF